jgi:protein-disulfide isomerase
MPSKREKAEAARARRVAEEQAQAARERRKRRLGIMGGTALAAAIVVAIVVAVSVSGGGGATSTASTSGPPAGAKQVADLLHGIPQQGESLGSPKAPVTLVEFEDLKCPVCKAYNEAAFPTIVRDYVRPGKVRVQFVPQDFVGAQEHPHDSERAARMALAAGQQNHFWGFTELFYKNQQDETTKYVTDDFLRRIGGAVPGLNVSKALAARDSAKISATLKQSLQRFTSNGFQGTPSFLVGTSGGTLKPLNARYPFTPSQFTGPIDALLKK